MSTPRNAGQTGYNSVQLTGYAETINSQAITTLLTNGNGDVLMCSGTVTVTDTSTGYAKGCIYIKTDVGAGTGGVYFNKGTNTSSAFTLVNQA